MAYDALAGDASETAHRRTVVVVVAFTAADDVWIDALVPASSLPSSSLPGDRLSYCGPSVPVSSSSSASVPTDHRAAMLLHRSSYPSSSFRKKLLS